MERKTVVPINEVEKSRFYEKVFKEHKIAIVNSDYVCEVMFENGLWMRRNISRKFYNLEIAIYQINSYLIVFLARSEMPVLLKEFDHPIEISVVSEHDFIIKHVFANEESYERYQWLEKEMKYEVVDCGNVVPDNYKPIPPRGSDHQWLRVYYRSNSELKSVDNTIFYSFIAKYWED